MKSPPTLVLVAGEASGDQLGAALIRELRQRNPEMRFAGIGGTAMREAGMEIWWDCEELAVFGLFEVLAHFPRLLKIRRALQRRVTALAPQAYIGIDAPDFNLGLEIKLRKAGIPTVHYVSPTVWAWRPGRVKKIARACDLVLCLFPFEPDFYHKHGVQACYVGHPMADQIPLHSDASAAREALAGWAKSVVWPRPCWMPPGVCKRVFRRHSLSRHYPDRGCARSSQRHRHKTKRLWSLQWTVRPAA